MIVLVIFMILTAIALERSVVKRALEAEESRLQLLIYGLLAAVDRNRSGLSITIARERLFENSLMIKDSGLNALLYNQRREVIWQSRSVTKIFPDIVNMQPGDWRFGTFQFHNKPYFRLAFALQWPDVRDKLQRYDVVIWQDASSYFSQRDLFRQTLWAWLIITILLLLAVMYIVMMWSLRPLIKVGEEIEAIEGHRQSGFEGHYPKEIKPLTENLNILLNREKHQRQRYRNAMDDLAHSLKTPLAVLKGLSQTRHLDNDDVQSLREQVDRMDQIVSYQLQKATSVGGGEILLPIEIKTLTIKVLSVLEKVYRDKGVNALVKLPADVLIRMDEGDYLEVIGNLLDNAFKYSRGQIKVSSQLLEQGKVQLEVEDDGEGLDPSRIDKILNRGTRLDEASEGQGIGLAVVADIVKTYDIGMAFSQSDMNGLKVRLIFQTA